jgi:hypothetical protein
MSTSVPGQGSAYSTRAATADRLGRLQAAMKAGGLDGLLLGGEGAGLFAAGHRRIGVHIAGSPIPSVVVPAAGFPHVVTADPDGALDLPADHVHGMMWNPSVLVDELPKWLGAAPGLRIGVDVLSPGGRALAEAALPGCELVDASLLLAEVMLPKADDEIASITRLCQRAAAAAQAGLLSGREALYRALEGAFPAAYPILGADRAWVSIRDGGFVGEARIGPGDPAIGHAALAQLVSGRTAAQVAAALPPGVEVVGLGRSYEAPVLRSGSAHPADLRLVAGAVLAVHWQSRGLVAALRADGTQVISDPSGEGGK